MNAEQFSWMTRGSGIPPKSVSAFQADSTITDFAGMFECGDFVLSDDQGTLYRLDALLNVSLITRLQEPVSQLAWSATGNAGSALIGKNTIIRLDDNLKVVWSVEAPFDCSTIAIDPFGTYTFVASKETGAIVLDDRGKRASSIETARCLAYAQFLVDDPIIIAAAEHGLLGAYTVSGEKIWQQNISSNVGGLSLSQKEIHIYLAALNHGLQVYDGQGETAGGYFLEGTVDHIAASYQGNQIFASTVENQLFRLDENGELLWAATPESLVTHLYSHPLGKQGVAVFESNQLVMMQW
ncbi:MAG: hypothetical protein JKY95_13160 [Planctomycetaceae bacterium]|nr:hypothetical protein [Planctomycetaceae bacterium]